MSQRRFVGKPIARIDALEKALGKTRFMSDLVFPNMLWGKALRAAYPHAWIRRIDTTRAEQLPGVRCVLTHRHVMGLNGFGIVKPDQPVLCHDKVRYVGDAVALVAAETESIAEPPNVAICPAILNAIYDAIRVRICDIPVTPEKLLAEIERQGKM